MHILIIRNECASLFDREEELGTAGFNLELDRLGNLLGGKPRNVVEPIVRKMAMIDREEIVAHDGLTIAHWLVLADLIPLDRGFRRFWAIRCVNCGFSAKTMRVELAAAVAMRKVADPVDVNPTRKKEHKG